MSAVRFSWDDAKAVENLRKHAVSFEEAASVFADENARFMQDTGHSDDEDRFVLLGFSAKLRMLVVCHAYREDDEVIRIISARPATPRERRQYRSFQ